MYCLSYFTCLTSVHTVKYHEPEWWWPLFRRNLKACLNGPIFSFQIVCKQANKYDLCLKGIIDRANRSSLLTKESLIILWKSVGTPSTSSVARLIHDYRFTLMSPLGLEPTLSGDILWMWTFFIIFCKMIHRKRWFSVSVFSCCINRAGGAWRVFSPASNDSCFLDDCWTMIGYGKYSRNRELLEYIKAPFKKWDNYDFFQL